MPNENKSVQSLFLDICKRSDVVKLVWQEEWRDDHPMLGYKMPMMVRGKIYRTRDPLARTYVLVVGCVFGNVYLVCPEDKRGVKVYFPERLYRAEHYLARKLLFPNGETLLEARELMSIVGTEAGKDTLNEKINSLLLLVENCNG